MNDFLYVFVARLALLVVGNTHYNFSSAALLRTIHQSTPFSVWRMKRTDNSLLSQKEESATSAGGESKWLAYQEYQKGCC
jgi:hypothetical protein